MADVLSLYRAGDEGPRLLEELADNWAIFSARATGDRMGFVDAICAASGMELRGSDFVVLKDDAVGDSLWGSFRQTIAKLRRWHSPLFGDLNEVLDLMVETRRDRIWPQGRDLYRARVCGGSEVRFTYRDLGHPPAGLASAGRANSAGIPVLYTATTPEIAMYECRPNRGATVAVARVRPRSRSVRLLDLSPTADAPLNPFDVDASTAGLSALRIAGDLGSAVGAEFSRPVRVGDDVHDYVPTQYIAEFVASLGYDGIVYKSSFSGGGGPEGENVALFDLSVATVVQKVPEHHYVESVVWQTTPSRN